MTRFWKREIKTRVRNESISITTLELKTLFWLGTKWLEPIPIYTTPLKALV